MAANLYVYSVRDSTSTSIYSDNSAAAPHFFGDLCQCKNYAFVNFKHQPLMSNCKLPTIIIVHHSLKTYLWAEYADQPVLRY